MGWQAQWPSWPAVASEAVSGSVHNCQSAQDCFVSTLTWTFNIYLHLLARVATSWEACGRRVGGLSMTCLNPLCEQFITAGLEMLGTFCIDNALEKRVPMVTIRMEEKFFRISRSVSLWRCCLFGWNEQWSTRNKNFCRDLFNAFH